MPVVTAIKGRVQLRRRGEIGFLLELKLESVGVFPVQVGNGINWLRMSSGGVDIFIRFTFASPAPPQVRQSIVRLVSDLPYRVVAPDNGENLTLRHLACFDLHKHCRD
jgi:hypothetical protein